MTTRFTLSALAPVALLALAIANPVSARDRSIDVQGLLVKDDLSGEQMERRVLKSGIRNASRYRILTAMYVLRAPTVDFWEDSIGPALEDAMDSDRPVEALRSTILGLEEYLVAGPDDAGVRINWKTPGARGQGFANYVAPVVIGPDGGLTSHKDANKAKVVTGWFVDEADDAPVIEAVGLKSTPDVWTGGPPRMPKLSSLPDRGEGIWVKYKGRSEDDPGEDMERSIRSVERLAERDYIAADRAIGWPREGGEYMKDTLTSARYRTRAPDLNPGEAVDRLRNEEVADWEWETKKVKHPTRYGISTITVNAETEQGEEVGEVFGFVVFYTPLIVDFDSAHLYVGTSPEFFAGAVQKGEIPFFEYEGEPRFYLGHLDRWVSGEALEAKERPISRRLIEKTADRWARDMSGNDARGLMSLAKTPNHWPLRLVPSDDDDDRGYKVLAHKDDLVSWWRRFERSLRPDDMDWFEPVYTLAYTGEAASVDIGVLFGGETRELDLGYVVADEGGGAETEALAARESAGLSDKDRARIEQEKAKEDKARKEAEAERAEEKRLAEERRRKEEERLAEEERLREEARIAQANAPIDVRLLDVGIGSVDEKKPYLATRAGRNVPIKVKYEVEGKTDGHKVQIVAQAYDRSGNPIKDFVAKGSSTTPKVGENETTTYLKVPSSYTAAAQQGSYRVLTRLELDGVPLRGEREEFVHLGKPLQLKRIELDPEVVLPGEEAILLMDLEVGGWSIDADVNLDVSIKYTVGGEEKTDTFAMTRPIGFHELEVDLDVPDGLPPGDGAYIVTVAHESGEKAEAAGTLRVFAKEVVDSDEEGGRRGRRRRVAVEDNEELEALAAKAEDDDDDRDVVRRSDRYEDDEEMFDFEAEDELEEVEEERRAKAEAKKRKQEEERRRREEAEREREEEERRQAEAERRREEDDRRQAKADEDRRKKKAADDARKQKEDDDRRQAEDDERREQEEADRRKAKKAKDEEPADEELDLDDEDLDLDEALAEDEPAEEERPPKKKEEPEEAGPAFDWDNLPDTVFFEDEEEEVLMWAEADGVGIVRIYGEDALDRMGTFYAAFQKAFGDGAPAWLWVCYEGDHKPHLSFDRYSNKDAEWVTVHQSPARFTSSSEKKQALDLMKAVFEGFIPERKKKVRFGKL